MYDTNLGLNSCNERLLKDIAIVFTITLENPTIPKDDDTIAAVKVLKRRNKRKGALKMK